MYKQKGFSAIEGLLIVFVIAVIGAASFYVSNRSNDGDAQLSVDSSESSELKEELPTNLDGLKTIEEIEAIAGVSDTVSIIGYKLESSDSGSEYVITLSNGKKLVIDAVSGEVLSEESTDVSSSSSNIAVNVSLKEAYAIASSRYDSPIKEIEFELEDNEATYKIEYRDGSKVEIDATSGTLVKFETDDDSEDNEKQEDEREDEDEDEYEDEDREESEEEDESEDESEDEDEDDDESEDEDRR